jgi:hypothetical protein
MDGLVVVVGVPAVLVRDQGDDGIVVCDQVQVVVALR